MSMITIVLVRPMHPGNIGAIARVMANFGLSHLVLVNPECDHLCKESLDRAKHAQRILKKAKLAELSFLDTFDYVIGTTCRIGTSFNITRSPLMPWEAASSVNTRTRVAIVFGSEGQGLTNEDLKQCHYIATIPTAQKYAAMNVSHAASIVLYEFFTKQKKPIHEPATKRELRLIDQFFHDLIDALPFPQERKKETQRKVWKKLFAKAMVSKREAFAVLGFLKKTLTVVRK